MTSASNTVGCYSDVRKPSKGEWVYDRSQEKNSPLQPPFYLSLLRMLTQIVNQDA